jgi:hypothetical protein
LFATVCYDVDVVVGLRVSDIKPHTKLIDLIAGKHIDVNGRVCAVLAGLL